MIPQGGFDPIIHHTMSSCSITELHPASVVTVSRNLTVLFGITHSHRNNIKIKYNLSNIINNLKLKNKLMSEMALTSNITYTSYSNISKTKKFNDKLFEITFKSRMA